jgi:hypothetical protein
VAQSGNYSRIVEFHTADEIRAGSRDVQDGSEEKGGELSVILSMDTYGPAANSESRVAISEALYRDRFDWMICLESVAVVKNVPVSTRIVKASVILGSAPAKNGKCGDYRGIVDASNECKRGDFLFHNFFRLFRVREVVNRRGLLPASLPHRGVGGPWPSERLNRTREASRWFSMTWYDVV